MWHVGISGSGHIQTGSGIEADRVFKQSGSHSIQAGTSAAQVIIKRGDT